MKVLINTQIINDNVNKYYFRVYRSSFSSLFPLLAPTVIHVHLGRKIQLIGNYIIQIPSSKTYTHTHTHTQTYTCTHTHVHMHTQTCTHVHMHTHTCTHVHMHTDGQMDTHAYLAVCVGGGGEMALNGM